MKTRILEISNFKNIGISTEDENFNESKNIVPLRLNASATNEPFGGLVILIGENNTGKSNVSKALAKFAFRESETFSSSDYPTFDGCESYEPQLNLKVVEYNGGGGQPKPLAKYKYLAQIKK